MDETNFVHPFGSKAEQWLSVDSSSSKTCPRRSDLQLCCAMVMGISQLGSVSIRLPCCLCDKCAACRRWQTLPAFSLSSSPSSCLYVLFQHPQSAYPHTLSLLSNISSSFRLGVGVKLKEMVLRSSVCHGSVKFPFQSHSVSARFIFEVCGVVPVCQHGF